MIAIAYKQQYRHACYLKVKQLSSLVNAEGVKTNKKCKLTIYASVEQASWGLIGPVAIWQADTCLGSNQSIATPT